MTGDQSFDDELVVEDCSDFNSVSSMRVGDIEGFSKSRSNSRNGDSLSMGSGIGWSSDSSNLQRTDNSESSLYTPKH